MGAIQSKPRPTTGGGKVPRKALVHRKRARGDGGLGPAEKKLCRDRGETKEQLSEFESALQQLAQQCFQGAKPFVGDPNLQLLQSQLTNTEHPDDRMFESSHHIAEGFAKGLGAKIEVLASVFERVGSPGVPGTPGPGFGDPFLTGGPQDEVPRRPGDPWRLAQTLLRPLEILSCKCGFIV